MHFHAFIAGMAELCETHKDNAFLQSFAPAWRGFADRGGMGPCFSFGWDFLALGWVNGDPSIRQRLPFKGCMIRLKYGSGHIFSVMVQEEDRILCTGALVTSDRRWSTFSGWLLPDGMVNANLGAILNADETTQVLGMHAFFLDSLNQPTTKVAEVSVSPKLQAKRAKRGDKPLLEYREVVVTKEYIKYVSEQKDKREAPRLHLRRGHFRRSDDGFVWVRPAWVGDKNKGVILHDYSLGATA